MESVSSPSEITAHCKHTRLHSNNTREVAPGSQEEVHSQTRPCITNPAESARHATRYHPPTDTTYVLLRNGREELVSANFRIESPETAQAPPCTAGPLRIHRASSLAHCDCRATHCTNMPQSLDCALFAPVCSRSCWGQCAHSVSGNSSTVHTAT